MPADNLCIQFGSRSGNVNCLAELTCIRADKNVYCPAELTCIRADKNVYFPSEPTCIELIKMHIVLRNKSAFEQETSEYLLFLNAG